MHKKIKIEHLCRVEGHGGITVEVEDKKVTRVNMDIFEGFRFFEGILVGRNYDEAVEISCRICAICSAVHKVSSLLAVEDAFGVKVSLQTELLRELLVQGGNIESHALHVFCLALPDFLGYTGVISLAADYPEEVKLGLGLKKLGNAVQEIIGGRAIHSVNPVLGGFGKVPTEDELKELKEQLLKGLEDILSAVDFLSKVEIPNFSKSPAVYVALNGEEDKFGLFGDKIVTSNNYEFVIKDYKKICNEFITVYSHAKFSKFQKKPFMVGALARLILNGHKLSGKAKEIKEILWPEMPRDNILQNNIAQFIETIYSIERAIEIIEKLLEMGLKKEKPIKINPRAGTGVSAIEAPRGTLYHSYSFNEEGKVISADIITPTAQNLANYEKDLRATTENFIEDNKEDLSRKLEMIVRAYDPCISCATHLVEVKYK